MFHERFERYEQALKKWKEQLTEIFDARKRAKSDIERLTRDAAAARLAVLDAKLHLSDLEKQIEKHRKVRPEKPEPQ